ncbi:unnamed protein product [Cylindrotheca closterium]|uniref:Uncharacterized protein n=1 Tax=Cylindrotheca closterium TaxID=2856 RepID=A0AAD2FL56_9STRA|nr:unnamed protein product [Cylindrotheca closterium]
MGKSPAPQAASANTTKLGVVKSKAYSVGKKLVKKRLGIDLEQPKDRGPVHSSNVNLKRLANKQGAPQMGDKMEAQQIAARQDTCHIDHYNTVVPKLSEWRLEQLYSGDVAVQLLTRLDCIQTGNALFSWAERCPDSQNQPCL